MSKNKNKLISTLLITLIVFILILLLEMVKISEASWKPVPPKGNFNNETDILISLVQENARDLFERYKKNTTQGRLIGEIEKKANDGINLENNQNDLKYATKFDIFRVRFNANAEYKGLKFLFQTGLGLNPEASIEHEDKFIRYNFKNLNVGIKKAW
jgi:hypothetical protein